MHKNDSFSKFHVVSKSMLHARRFHNEHLFFMVKVIKVMVMESMLS